MELRLIQKNVVVTGGASGIGEETAKAFSREGARVAILDVDSGRGDRVLQEIRKEGGKADFFRIDLTSEPDIRVGISRIAGEFGGIDILVNNAARYRQGDVRSFRKIDLEDLLAINIVGVLWMTRYVTESMISSGKKGVIVNVASEAGLVGIQNQVIYNLTKAAVISITRSCAIDLAPHGIRVNCVCPGTTETPLLEEALSRVQDPASVRSSIEKSRPLCRLGQPEEIASAILMMATDRLGYATGAVLSIDGGYTVW
ncbi:MAG TPA: SDR family oxidoreductase [Atribacteraceae bacterium]|nr:SDR family oxidoreductase [Atribacteraceae bacterium]